MSDTINNNAAQSVCEDETTQCPTTVEMEGNSNVRCLKRSRPDEDKTDETKNTVGEAEGEHPDVKRAKMNEGPSATEAESTTTEERPQASFSFFDSLSKLNASQSTTNTLDLSVKPLSSSNNGFIGGGLFGSSIPTKLSLTGLGKIETSISVDIKPEEKRPAATSSILESANLLGGPFGAPATNSEKEDSDPTEPKEVVTEIDDEEGYDVLWMDKSVRLYRLQDGKFARKGDGVLKILRPNGGTINDRACIFRQRGTKSILFTSRLTDNLILGDRSKAMSGGMKGVMFSTYEEAGTSESDQRTCFIIRFDIDATREAFLQWVDETKGG